jgi:glycosidase
MLFNFPVMQAMYLALARQDARPLAAALEALPPIPDECQWATFVRNHDELTLDQLTEEERQEVFDAFGPEEGMQLYGRGLRRRLPPMLDGHEGRLRMVYSLLLSLPGTPVLFYGEEIGMGEELAVEGRMAVRTPMQWTDGRNGGFSDAPPSRLVRPVTTGRFGPLAVNVADQRRDPGSLLNWFERALRRRRELPEIGWGTCRLLDAGAPAVLAHEVRWHEDAVLALHNLSAEPVEVALDVPDVEGAGPLVDLLEDGHAAPELRDGRLALKLEGYGARWFGLRRPAV